MHRIWIIHMMAWYNMVVVRNYPTIKNKPRRYSSLLVEYGHGCCGGSIPSGSSFNTLLFAH